MLGTYLCCQGRKKALALCQCRTDRTMAMLSRGALKRVGPNRWAGANYGGSFGVTDVVGRLTALMTELYGYISTRGRSFLGHC
jgi:hypothetical protein